jgi:hypothetical protein
MSCVSPLRAPFKGWARFMQASLIFGFTVPDRI